ncbi:hypothetical protein M885DRAFT_533719 [Pelagophyceae sp. CCMP2097]|nr:hypothetical protein M885DRAFT_533719 [Pelagophyceae sp. CCMP2097]
MSSRQGSSRALTSRQGSSRAVASRQGSMRAVFPAPRPPASDDVDSVALREQLRITTNAFQSHHREAQRALSHAAQRLAMSPDGAELERAKFESDVRSKRLTDALRDKDAALCDALYCAEALEATLARERAERKNVDQRVAGLEARLRTEGDRAREAEHALKDLRRDAAEFKGQLAQAYSDCEVAERKYEALLAKVADEGATSDIVDRAARRALQELDSRAAAEELDGDDYATAAS